MKWLVLLVIVVTIPLWTYVSNLRDGFIREYEKLVIDQLQRSSGLLANASCNATDSDAPKNISLLDSLQADINASKEFHAEVQSMHKDIVSLSRKLDTAKFDQERLLLRMTAERLLLAHLIEEQQFLICEVANIRNAVGRSISFVEQVPNCGPTNQPGARLSLSLHDSAAQFTSQLAHQARTSALLAVAQEDLLIINKTQATQLRQDCKTRGRDVSQLQKQLPADSKRFSDEATKKAHAQLGQHPGVGEDGFLNLTALTAALSQHVAKWWIMSGWGRFSNDLSKDWQSCLRATYARRRKLLLIFVTRHRKHTGTVKIVEAYLISQFARTNSTFNDIFGISLQATLHQLWNAVDQCIQVITEVAVVIGHLCTHIEAELGIAQSFFNLVSSIAKWAWFYFRQGLIAVAFGAVVSASIFERRFRRATAIIEVSCSFPTACGHPGITLLVLLLAPIIAAVLAPLLLYPLRYAISIQRLFIRLVTYWSKRLSLHASREIKRTHHRE